jgi:hypothetical protein
VIEEICYASVLPRITRIFSVQHGSQDPFVLAEFNPGIIRMGTHSHSPQNRHLEKLQSPVFKSFPNKMIIRRSANWTILVKQTPRGVGLISIELLFAIVTEQILLQTILTVWLVTFGVGRRN